MAHPEVVFEPQRAATEGSYVGHDGIRRFLIDTAETFDLFRPTSPTSAISVTVCSRPGQSGVRGRESGVETDISTAVIADYRDGLLWRYTDYGEARMALEAAGLSE
jgi:hypothetical protein